MSDAVRFRALIDDGAWLHPLAGDAGIVDLALALASLCGAAVERTPRADAVAASIGAHDHIIFVLADGLGMHLVDGCDEAAFLRAHLAMPLRSVFPSSTAPALTSLATCLPPAAHAVTGWWTYLPGASVTAMILPYIERFSGVPLQRLGIEPGDAFPAPSLQGAFQRDRASFMPAHIAGSVTTRYFSSGGTSLPYRRLASAADAIAARVGAATAPTYTHLYIPFVDQAQHERGPGAPAVRRALASAVAQIERLAALVAGRARIVLSADHGQVRIGERHIVNAADPLMAHLRVPPYGEPRVPMFAVREGHAEAFAREFRKRLGERFVLLSVDEVERLRLWGDAPLTDETRRRIGDFIAPALGDDVLLYEPGADLLAMAGTHGGLTPDEMRVPLVVI